MGLDQTATAPLELSEHLRKWITFGVMMGLFLGALETTVVGTAMPTVISHLGGLDLYSWVYSIYFLTMTVTVPLWGRLSDLYGRRTFYILGVSLFLAGSVLSGLSQSMLELIQWRALQGVGAGALFPLGMTIVGDIYSLERRAKIQGYFSGVWGLSSLAGPLIGGLVTDHLSWRWVFFLNVPFGAAAGLIIGLAFREPKTGGKRRLDFLGAGLLITALTLVLLGLDRWGKNGLTGQALGLLAGGIALLAVFVMAERRAPDPIVPLELFGDRIFTAAALNGMFCSMALFGAITFIPLFVQGSQGTQATQAGLALTPLMLGWVSFSIVAGRALLIFGYRRTVLAGMVLLMAGFFGLARIDSSVTPFHFTLVLVAIGAGMGLGSITMLLAVQNRFPRNRLGIATSGNLFFRSIGGAIGIAVMGSVFSRQVATLFFKLESEHPSAQLARFVAQPDSIVDPVARSAIPPDLLRQLQDALGVALQSVFLVGLIIAILAFASALLVPAGSVRDHARREG